MKVKFTAKAFKKTAALVADFATEVEWHGFVQRTDDGFCVEDIVVFPHKASGAYVESDQKEYEKWMDTLTDEQVNSMSLHGHSHVNMPPYPSGFDSEFRNKVLKNMPSPKYVDDVFYIFMIFNKEGQFTCQVNDIKNDKVYIDKDVEVEFEDGDYDTTEFIAEAKELVKPFIPTCSEYVPKAVPISEVAKTLAMDILYGDEELAEVAMEELWRLRSYEFE